MFKLLGMMASIMSTDAIIKKLEEGIEKYKLSGESDELKMSCLLASLHFGSEGKSLEEVSKTFDKVEAVSKLGEISDN